MCAPHSSDPCTGMRLREPRGRPLGMFERPVLERPHCAGPASPSRQAREIFLRKPGQNRGHGPRGPLSVGLTLGAGLAREGPALSELPVCRASPPALNMFNLLRWTLLQSIIKINYWKMDPKDTGMHASRSRLATTAMSEVPGELPRAWSQRLSLTHLGPVPGGHRAHGPGPVELGPGGAAAARGTWTCPDMGWEPEGSLPGWEGTR